MYCNCLAFKTQLETKQFQFGYILGGLLSFSLFLHELDTKPSTNLIDL